jgi:Protein of unknown function (DUF4236)
MGFYLRKSLRAGPFRFNLSKSGLGVSAGVPGFRVGTGPRGNYVHVGAHGVYYRASLGGNRRAPSPRPTMPGWQPRPGSDVVLDDTTGATASELLPSSPDEFVAQLNDAAKRFRLWPWTLAAILVLAAAGPPAVAIVALLLGLVAVPWVFLRDRARRSVVAFYEVDGPQAIWFQALVDAFVALGRSSGVWRVNASGDVETTYQYKVNSGASSIINRGRARITSRGPKTLVTNIVVPGIEAGGHSVHFLPDRVLVRDGRRFASVSYASLDATATPQRFIESGRVPSDARQVDTTWQYVNVKGGPDRRFNNNRQLPVMLYGRLVMTSPAGLRWIIDASQRTAAERVSDVLRRAIENPPT